MIDTGRRILLSLLVVLLTVYSAAVAIEVWNGDLGWVHGEIGAAVISAIGLVALLPRRPGRVRRVAAELCVALAPPTSMLFHVYLEAQVWGLIPTMFLALYLRALYPMQPARMMCLGLAALSVSALLLAPAPAPPFWAFLYVVSILGASEIYGALGAALRDGALRDPLTALWNRAGVLEATDYLVDRAHRRREHVAVVVFDIDDFKKINDRDGHAAGDRILVDLSARWSKQAPAGSVIARLGGDEFVMILSGYDRDAASALAGAMTDGHHVGVTYGVAVGPPDTDVLEYLIPEADADLYRRKARPGNA